MKNFILRVYFFLLILFSIVGCTTNQTKQEEVKKPNIIFLMDDQHRHDALGVENPIVVTPNLDKLAKDGLRFSQAVCQAPMCVPSRNSMMLGLYPNQVGILRNGPGLQDSLLPAIPLAQLFKDGGYETAGFGKTHWGSSRQPFLPSTRGFETRYIAECREEGANMMIDLDPEKKAHYSEEVKNYGGGEELPAGYIGKTSEIEEGEHRDGWVFDKCVDYIRHRQDDRPLFLYLSFLKPHAAHNVPQGYEQYYNKDEMPYAQQPNWDEDYSPHALGINRRETYINFWKNATPDQWRTMTMRYYANCSWMDDMFGRALKELKEKGLLDNAIIIYVSDHGEMLGERYYRFNKYCLYESSVRVPFILSGSALPKSFKNKIDTRQVELVDVYPTLLQLAGIKVPQTAMGLNLMDTTQTRQASFCALHEKKGQASFMWRNSNYKLILVMNRKDEVSMYTSSDVIDGELYQLKEDPIEYNNLFQDTSYTSIKEDMSMQLLQYMHGIKKSPALSRHK